MASVSNMLNVCRCCLTQCWYRNLSDDHYFSDQKVYEEMMRETFDIELQQLGKDNILCEACIGKLQEACSFKKMVQNSEEHLRQRMSVLVTEEVMLPLDHIKVDQQVDPFENDLITNALDSCDEDNEILANIKMELNCDNTSTEYKECAPSPPNKKHRLRNNMAIEERSDKVMLDCSKNQKDWTKIVEQRGNGPILRENSLKILQHSTVCVFQWNKSRYRCFCCKEPFSDMTALKKHTNTSHTLQNIEKRIIVEQNRLVKVEISTAKCKLCENEFENLNMLKEHLNRMHDIHFKTDEDLLVPFKIEDNLKCQLCSEKFTLFRLLNIHMNKHYQKQVCHVCGAGFSNLIFLNLHKTRSHREFSCKQCCLIFPRKLDKKRHDINVHNLKVERKSRFPCPYCEKRFTQENFRVQHLIDNHGLVKPDHKCNFCDKTFLTKSYANNHMKNVHMKEKKHECDICHHFFYKKADVVRHKVTHTKEKKFSCSVCNNLYATRDSLRKHVKKTHIGIH